jgi:uncharacterized protein YabN with tetrapyrrole methylase and pyrophosphatase domain
MFILLNKSTLKSKKYSAIFYNSETEKKIKTVNFGAHEMGDYLIYTKKDSKEVADLRKSLYIKRNQKRQSELWDNNPMSPAALSRWLLWNKDTMKDSVDDYINRFDTIDKVIINKNIV